MSIEITSLDHALDYLRENRLHPALEAILSWFIALFCLLYYGFSYLFPHQRRIDAPLNLEPLPAREGGKYTIALVIPAYREDGQVIQNILRDAHAKATDPSKIQVIVVDAGHCEHLNLIEKLAWAKLEIIEYREGGGRGPTLNAGAAKAASTFLTFLHADTILPSAWDRKVIDTLNHPYRKKTVQACAFSFGHNLSKSGLGKMSYPWGIRSVFLLGNLRAYCFALPYGDHVISMSTTYFHFFGGFPNQPIMEEYELMDILRRRAKKLPELIRIIPPPTALCGVRRWQMHGVPYTTLVNFLIVYRYIRGWTPQEIFDYYYHRPHKKQE